MFGYIFLLVIYLKSAADSILQILMQSYKLTDLIGQGSFGSVFLAQSESGQSFALKKIHVGPFQVQQALQQIDLMKKLIHPNLVQILDFHYAEQDEQVQILMEYCESDLMKYFKKETLFKTEDLLNIFKQIVKAFIFMSVNGVIHRDLKPENCLLSKGTIVKIGDFGCAKAVGQGQTSRIIQQSFQKGTYLYVSPQQIMNEAYTFKCDVWAAGCIAYLFSFGIHPFFANKPDITLQKIKDLTKGKYIELKPSPDPVVAKLISLCLIFEDKQRASWRELWLSRLFSPRVKDIKRFISYLKNLSSVASWITKQFWKIRKQFNISRNSDEIFAYFIIKFQYSNLKMALKILKKSPNYIYLFDQSSFHNYQPSQQQFNQIKQSYLQHQKYYASIKKTMQSKQSFKQIESRQMVRSSSFADLDRSIRACYRILQDIKGQVKDHPQRKNKVLMAMCYWINMEAWFSYQKDPNIQKLHSGDDIEKVMQVEMRKYQNGYVQ